MFRKIQCFIMHKTLQFHEDSSMKCLMSRPFSFKMKCTFIFLCKGAGHKQFYQSPASFHLKWNANVFIFEKRRDITSCTEVSFLDCNVLLLEYCDWTLIDSKLSDLSCQSSSRHIQWLFSETQMGHFENDLTRYVIVVNMWPVLSHVHWSKRMIMI